MTARDLCTIIPLCVLTAARGSAADTPVTRVTVRVYETPGLDPQQKAAALHLAGDVLASASIDVSWKHCASPDAAGSCDAPPLGELVVRIVRSTMERGDRHLPLGDAFVDTGTGSAVLATVYVDRVDRVAKAARMQVQRLLGYAIAHELGHLLLASNAHNTRGLMRPIWHDDELRSDRDADWSFTVQDIAAIRGASR